MEPARDPPGPENVDKKCFKSDQEVKIVRIGVGVAHAVVRCNPDNLESQGSRFGASSGETSIRCRCSTTLAGFDLQVSQV